MDIRWCVYAVVAFTLAMLVALLVVELPSRQKRSVSTPDVSARLTNLRARLDTLDHQIMELRCRVESLKALSRRKW